MAARRLTVLVVPEVEQHLLRLLPQPLGLLHLLLVQRRLPLQQVAPATHRTSTTVKPKLVITNRLPFRASAPPPPPQSWLQDPRLAKMPSRLTPPLNLPSRRPVTSSVAHTVTSHPPLLEPVLLGPHGVDLVLQPLHHAQGVPQRARRALRVLGAHRERRDARSVGSEGSSSLWVWRFSD